MDWGFHQAEAEELNMVDATPVTTEITRLIITGTTEQALLRAVKILFPELTSAETATLGPLFHLWE